MLEHSERHLSATNKGGILGPYVIKLARQSLEETEKPIKSNRKRRRNKENASQLWYNKSILTYYQMQNLYQGKGYVIEKCLTYEQHSTVKKLISNQWLQQIKYKDEELAKKKEVEKCIEKFH